MKASPMQPISVVVEPRVRAQLIKIAREDQRTLAAQVRIALDRYLATREKEKKA